MRLFGCYIHQASFFLPLLGSGRLLKCHSTGAMEKHLQLELWIWFYLHLLNLLKGKKLCVMCFFLHYCALITVRVWPFCVTHYRGCRVQCLLISFSFEVHARRIQALKALTYAPSSNSEILSRLYEIVFGLLDKVCPAPTFTISLASSSGLHFFNC